MDETDKGYARVGSNKGFTYLGDPTGSDFKSIKITPFDKKDELGNTIPKGSFIYTTDSGETMYTNNPLELVTWYLLDMQKRQSY